MASIPSFVGNSNAPQLVDLGRAAGYGIVFAVVTSATCSGAQYTFGTHAAAMYDQNSRGSQVFKAVITAQSNRGFTFVNTLPQYVDPPQPIITAAQESINEVKSQPFVFITASPQAYDFTLQALFDTPTITETLGMVSQYTFGLHQAALYNSQISSQVWSPIIPPVVATQLAPLQTIIASPQELSYDLTRQGWFTNIPLNQGWVLTFAGASPQAFDFTLQATFTLASSFTFPQIPIGPRFTGSVSQADPTQIQPTVWRPTLAAAQVPKPQQQPFVTAAPVPSFDQTQQALITKAAIAGGSKYPMRPIITAPQQSYVDIFPTPRTRPVIGTYIPPVVPVPPYTCTPLWDFSGQWNWSFDGFPGWSWDGYEPTPLQCAVQGLAAFGVNVGALTYVCSNTVPVGWVITGWVPYMNVAYAGKYIPLTISNGPCILPTPITAPSVVGMFYYDAQLAILDAGFDTAQPNWALSSTVLPQYVISQSIVPGTQFTQATQISIVVSGFPVVNQPNTIVPTP